MTPESFDFDTVHTRHARRGAAPDKEGGGL